MVSYLEFEKPIAALDTRIAELRAVADGGDIDISAEIERLEAKSTSLLASTYRALTPWQKTRVARHPMRPHFRDYVQALFTDFMPLSGDRRFGEDAAIIGGPARLDGRKVMLIGHEKGHDTQSRLTHNFGMAKPEGYRKAARLMEMAGRFGLPVVTLVDTSGAFPGVEAEERGQAEAIARAIEACAAGANGCGDSRRGRFRRSGGAGQRRAGADVRTRGLFGDFARRLRLDPVAQRGQSA